MEIGWRLRQDAWGHGYATEAAQACLSYAWDVLSLEKVYAYISTTRSSKQDIRCSRTWSMKLQGLFELHDGEGLGIRVKDGDNDLAPGKGLRRRKLDTDHFVPLATDSNDLL